MRGRITLQGVSKSYETGKHRVDALRGIDLDICGPGFFAIMGPSGSGKSTLLHLAAGLDRASSGSVVVDGVDVTAISEAELTKYRRTRIGIVFQKFNLLATMSALQNVMLPGLLDGRPDAWSRERAVELLRDLDLGDRLDHRPSALSGGEQQRVSIARSLFFEPKILFADEPTGNLDSQASLRIWKRLANLAHERGLTILMVTHEPAAAACCERVNILGDGRVIDAIEVGDHDAGWLANRYQQSVGEAGSNGASDHRGGAGDGVCRDGFDVA
jgi:putative ABC transport system ATP-binding protein